MRVVDLHLDGNGFLDGAATADARVGQARVRADDAVLAHARGAHKHDLRQQLHVALDFHIGADPYLIGVRHGNAGGHMALVDAALHNLRHLRQLNARVHAQALGGVVGGKRQHGAASVSADLQHVGQIKLALRIIVADLGQRVKQRAGIEAIEPGIALVDGGLLGRGILLFDDALNLASLVANDASITGGVVKLHGQHHHAALFSSRT